MRLSKEGIKKIIEACACDWDGIFDLKFTEAELEATPFIQEDFKDCVMLTLDEAKDISAHLYELAYLYSIQVLGADPDSMKTKELSYVYDGLNNKIIRAMKTLKDKENGT